MKTLKGKKRFVIIITAIILAVATVSTLIYALPVEGEEITSGKRVEIYARGIAKQKIENETVKMPVALKLTLYLGERHGPFTPITGAQGKLDVNGTVYAITCGSGGGFHRKEQAFIRLSGTDYDNQTFTVRLYAEYFWMGGNWYVARSIGILKTDVQTRLLLRAKAQVFP